MILVLVSAHPDSCGNELAYPHTSTYYANALASIGAVPLIASCAPPKLQAEAADALLLTGGGDFSPEYYRYRIPLSYIKPSGTARDAHEFALFQAFMQAGKPVLGVCRGMQLINVALGGTLWEDMSSELNNNMHTDGKTHPVEIYKNAWLFALFGCKIKSNSYHHQACRTLGAGLIPCARAEDGILEALTHASLPIYGVQWHPERMYIPGEKNDEDMRRLFIHFCESAIRRKENGGVQNHQSGGGDAHG